MSKNFRSGLFVAVFLFALTPALHLSAGPSGGQDSGRDSHGTGIQHVLLISIDGMHALDFINCANGITGANGGDPYCRNLAALKPTGVNYLYASTSAPSDSFPGLTALVSGSTPRSAGAFYDVAYDRSLEPPAETTGNGVAGSPGDCVPFAEPTGTTTEFDEGIDIDKTKLNGGAPTGVDGGVLSIEPRDWNATRRIIAPRFIHGTLFGRIQFLAWCMPPVATPPGPTSIRHTPQSPVPEEAWPPTWMTTTRRRSIRFRWPCRE